MTRNQEDKTEYEVEDSVFSFFEFLLIASRYQDEPTRIDNQDHADHREKCVEIREEFPNDANTCIEVYFFDITGTH